MNKSLAFSSRRRGSLFLLSLGLMLFFIPRGAAQSPTQDPKETIDQPRQHFSVLSSGQLLQVSFLSTVYLDLEQGQPLIAGIAWCQRDAPVECSPASGSFSLTIRMATPVTLPTISACEGWSNRRTSWWE
jgi:hypothetical protein